MNNQTSVEKTMDEKANIRILYVLALTLVLTVMNSTVFNVALPTIMKELNLVTLQGSWIGTGYLIVFAVGTLTYGKLTEKFKISTLITFGLIMLCIGSAIGLFAKEYTMLILSRLIQAVGASVMPTMGQIVPFRLFPAEKRGQALGVIAAAMSLGGLIGSVISGVITTFLGWRWLFVLPLAVLALLPVFRYNLRNEAAPIRPETGVDWFGAFLVLVAIAAFMLTFTLLNIWLAFATAFLFVAMIFWMRRSKTPFLQLSIFANRRFSLLLVITLMFGLLCFGIPYLLPLMLANVNAASAATIGLVIFPGTLIAAFLAGKGGKLADKKGNAFMVRLTIIPIIILITIMSASCGWSPVFTAVILAVYCICQVFLQVALNSTMSQTLTREESGTGLGLFMMINYIAGGMANVLLGLLLNAFSGMPVYILPSVRDSSAYPYSNSLLMMIVPAVVIGLLFIPIFRKRDKEA